MANKTKVQPMTNDEFAKHGGLQCPFCKSKNISSDEIQVDGPDAWTEDYCWECKESWKTFYSVTGYSKE